MTQDDLKALNDIYPNHLGESESSEDEEESRLCEHHSEEDIDNQ